MKTFLLFLALSPAICLGDEWNDVTTQYLNRDPPPSTNYTPAFSPKEIVGPSTSNHSYSDHREAGEESGEIVVLVTMNHCPYCDDMKATLDGLETPYAIVNYSDQPSLASKLSKSTSFPVLVKYEKVNGTWKARRLKGSTSREKVKTFLNTKGIYQGTIRLPGPSHPLRNTICGSRGCQMCVGIALNRNYGVSYETLRNDLGNDYRKWLTLWDNLNNLDAEESSTKSSNLAPYGETPYAAIPKLLDLAGVFPGSNVCDVGSGDGRVAIAAARRGAYAIGVEIDPNLVKEARDNASDVEGVQFIQANAIGHNYRGYDAILMYLTPNVTSKMLPALRRCNDGTKIVCWEYPLEGVRPTVRKLVEGKLAYLYITPLK